MLQPDPTPVQLIPLDEIAADALTRDRTALDAEAMAELQASILAHGLRQPIEVYALSDPSPTPAGPVERYGLISGHRRLAAVRTLRDGYDAARFAAIPAFLREPETLEAAMVAMVEENEIRADLSPWERGRIAVEARDRGVFATLDEAVEKLFPAANKSKRIRLRQLATLVDELDGHLHAPETLSQRNALRLAEACQRGHADLIRATLGALPRAQRPAQWDALAPILREMDETPDAGPLRPGRPRRLSKPHPGLVVRRERTRSGYTLHFTGPDASDMIMDAVFDEIDRLFSRG